MLHHLDRVVAWNNSDRIVPLHVDLGLTTGCQMGCTYCYGVIQGRTGYGTSVNQRFNMPQEAIIRFFTDAKAVGVRSVAIIGEGENTLNPALYESLAWAKKIDLDVSLATNGLLFKSDCIPDMLAALTWIRINLSAATQESFEKIHQITPFQKVLTNIQTLVETKRRLCLETTIGIQMVVTKDNMGDIVPLAKLSRELGADYFVVKACSDTPEKALDSPDNEYLEIEDTLKEAESYSTDDYSVIIKWNKLGNLGLKNYKVCMGTQFIIAISGDGTVFPCGHWFNIRRDEFEMGNIIRSSFRDIVKSERYWEVQKKIQTVHVNKDCESNCRPHYVNQFLWKIVNKPAHINFV